MGARMDKVKDELIEFIEEARDNLREVFVDNSYRYRNPREWHHLWADAWVSAVSILKAAVMPYTLGHILAVAVPAYFLLF